MDEQLLTQLDRRIEEHHQCLCQRLDDLAEVLQATHGALTARMDAHEAYHHRNEHKWGALKLAQKYPFRLAALTFLAAWMLLGSIAEASPWLGTMLGKIISFVLK